VLAANFSNSSHSASSSSTTLPPCLPPSHPASPPPTCCQTAPTVVALRPLWRWRPGDCLPRPSKSAPPGDTTTRPGDCDGDAGDTAHERLPRPAAREIWGFVGRPSVIARCWLCVCVRVCVWRVRARRVCSVRLPVSLRWPQSPPQRVRPGQASLGTAERVGFFELKTRLDHGSKTAPAPAPAPVPTPAASSPSAPACPWPCSSSTTAAAAAHRARASPPRARLAPGADSRLPQPQQQPLRRCRSTCDVVVLVALAVALPSPSSRDAIARRQQLALLRARCRSLCDCRPPTDERHAVLPACCSLELARPGPQPRPERLVAPVS